LEYRAQIAQSVEHRSEKPGVVSSILTLGTSKNPCSVRDAGFLFCGVGRLVAGYFPFYFPNAVDGEVRVWAAMDGMPELVRAGGEEGSASMNYASAED
jgi:hypothetical protein